jgi:hypothetical protein
MPGSFAPQLLTERRWDGLQRVWWALEYRGLTLRAAIVEEDLPEQIRTLSRTVKDGCPFTAFVQRFGFGLYGTLADPYDGQIHGAARDVLIALAYRDHPDWFAGGAPALRFTVDPSFEVPVHDGEIVTWPPEKVALYREFVTTPDRFVRIERVTAGH